MKKLLLLLTVTCFFLTGSTEVFAQKAKFKNNTVRVQKTRLPSNYVESNKRTYDLYAKGSYASQIDVHQGKVHGWALNQETPSVKGVVSIYGFTINSPSLKKEKKTKKDKDGNVTDTWTEYHYVGSAKGNGTLYVYGESNPFKYNAKNKPAKKSKFQEKQEAKAAEEKKALDANPFLSKEDVAEAEESDVGTDEGLTGDALPFQGRYNVDQDMDVKTSNYRSSSKAREDYYNNQLPKLKRFRADYPNDAYGYAISRLNSMYGYSPVKQSFSMRTMKSDKHEEFKTWNDAAKAAETLFKTVKYNAPINETQTKFDPIIKYFAGVVEKTATDKKGKKISKAAYKNLSNIMYYLDRHEDMIKIAEGYADNKYLDKYAKRTLADCKKMKAKLLFHKMETCHMESGEEISDDDFEVVEEAPEEADTEGN